MHFVVVGGAVHQLNCDNTVRTLSLCDSEIVGVGVVVAKNNMRS